MARGEQRGLAALAAPPDRADRVHDVTRRQPPRRGRLRVAGGAAAEQAALREDRGPARPVDRAVHAAAAEQRLVGRVHDRVDHLLGDVAPRRLDASGHRPVSIDFADAPAPILPRRSRLQPQDAGQGRGAPGRHGLPRPRGRRRAAREERRDAPERRRCPHGPRVDGSHSRRARQRRSTPRGASATSSTSSRAPRTRSTASCCRRSRDPITWPSRIIC